MSTKRRIARSMLRAVGPDEAGFRAALATVEHCRRLGFLDIQVGFFKAEGEDELSPAVVLHGKKADGSPSGFTFRLNNHKLMGTQEACDRRWREWVIALVGERQDISRDTMGKILAESFLGKERDAQMLTLAIERAGLVIPARQVHAVEDQGESCS
jgi:hypothetical protein